MTLIIKYPLKWKILRFEGLFFIQLILVVDLTSIFQDIFVSIKNKVFSINKTF